MHARDKLLQIFNLVWIQNSAVFAASALLSILLPRPFYSFYNTVTDSSLMPAP
jgi:hypothetical protein